MLPVMGILNICVYQNHLKGLLNQAPSGVWNKTGPRGGLRICIWTKSPLLLPCLPVRGWLLLLWALHFEDPDLTRTSE